MRSKQIPFRIRIKANVRVSYKNRTRRITSEFRGLHIGQTQVLRKARILWGVPVFLSAKRLSRGEWLLIASDTLDYEALDHYALRWSIETLFAALKTHGFNFEDTHLTDPERVDRLLAVLTLTAMWAIHVGEWANEQRPIRQKATLGRPQYGLFRYGLDILHRTVAKLERFAEVFYHLLSLLRGERPSNVNARVLHLVLP